jgi:hypothetical protein
MAAARYDPITTVGSCLATVAMVGHDPAAAEELIMAVAGEPNHSGGWV